MKYPPLVPKALCKTPIWVTIYQEGIDEDGAPLQAITLDTCCNWQDSAKIIRTDETHSVQLSGVALFYGDLCPELAAIASGTVIVFGEPRTIFRGSKARNPDGTVNYTRLELI
ncbi:MAG: hypothetical protein Q4F79_05630 [Eubacteriales bacterium]|nr:hypothetical protein [Eubacteriales bacterium]